MHQHSVLLLAAASIAYAAPVVNPLAPLVKPVDALLDPLENLGAGNALLGTSSSIISQADDALVSPLTQDNIGKRTIISGPIGAVAGTLAKGADVALAPAEGLESALHHVTKGRKHSRDVGKRFFPFFLTPPPLVAGAVAGGIAEGITEGIIEGSRDDFDRDNFDRDDFDRDDRDFRGRVGKRFFPFFLPPPPLVAGAVAGGIAEGITEGIIEGSRDDFDRE
jgi:uncharacterized protein (DUF697 family)